VFDLIFGIYGSPSSYYFVWRDEYPCFHAESFPYLMVQLTITMGTPLYHIMNLLLTLTADWIVQISHSC